MFVQQKLLYLELHKTGCSHVLKVLNGIPDFNGKIIGKHNAIYEVSKDQLGDLTTKLKVGNIRNPWDWYVSLWAFGCMKKGGVYEQLTNKRLINKLKNPKKLFHSSPEWIKVYETSDDPALFRNWLKMILITNRNDLHEYKRVNQEIRIGLMTSRYINLYTTDIHSERNQLHNFDDIIQFDKKNNFIDIFLYNETLDQDIKALLTRLQIQKSIIQQLVNAPRTNASKRKNYQEYYDEETRNLVAGMDKFIIAKHNYTF